MLMELFFAVLKIRGVENQLEQNWRDSTEGTCYDLISPLHNVVGQMWPNVASGALMNLMNSVPQFAHL